jgi:hypothetical protein
MSSNEEQSTLSENLQKSFFFFSVDNILVSISAFLHRLGFLRVTGMEDDLNDTERIHLVNSSISIQFDFFACGIPPI